MSGINTDINIKVKTSGLDELKNELKSILQTLDDNDISLNIDVDQIDTEEKLQACIKDLREFAKDNDIELDLSTKDSIKNIEELNKEIEKVESNIKDTEEVHILDDAEVDKLIQEFYELKKAKAEAAIAGADDFDNMFDDLLNDSDMLDDVTDNIKQLDDAKEESNDIKLDSSSFEQLAKISNLLNLKIPGLVDEFLACDLELLIAHAQLIPARELEVIQEGFHLLGCPLEHVDG
ncbi:MAG: hypothetical protein II625_02950, partial [Bacilli bacterium]|nr:hypothetical protein [Bacilli bacterium]